MLNQHTAQERMDQSDRFRLAEISAYIHRSNPHAQSNRLAFYLQEAHALLNTEQWQTLNKLADTVFFTVQKDDRDLTPDKDRTRMLTELQSMLLLGYAHTAETEKVLYHVESLSKALSQFSTERRANLRQNLLHATGVFVKKHAEQVSFDDGLVTLAFLEPNLSTLSQEQDSGWPNIVCLLYTSPSPRDLSTSRMPSSA